MPSHRLAMAAGIVSVLFAAAQVLYLYDSLHTFSPDHAWGIALLAFPCLAALNYPLLRLALTPILEAKYGLAALIVGLVVAAAATPAERFATAGISLANGSTFSAAHERARQMAFWAFHLHPEFGNQKPVHKISVSAPLLASAVRLRVAQPDSSRGLGDGVELHMDIQNGSAASSRPFPPWQLTPRQFPPKAWWTIKVPLHDGDRSIVIDVRSGPPGSTASYDATYVSVAFSGIGPRLANIGRLTLALVVVGAIGALFWQSRRILTPDDAHAFRSAWRAAVDPRTTAFVAILLAYTGAFYALDRTILYYDPLNYFFKTEAVSEAFRRLALGRVIGDVTASSLDEYTLWPALIPGLIASFVKWSLVAYALIITLVYMAPAALVCSVLGSRLLESKADQTQLVLGALSVCLLLPHFYKVALAPVPDVGGVIIACLFILAVSALCERVVQSRLESSSEDSTAERPLILYAMTAAALLVALFLFRRWYVFLASGVVLSALLVLATNWKSLSFKQCWIVASAAGLTLLLLLGGVICHWLQTPDKRDYAKLYAAYAWPLSDVAEDALNAFGWVVPLTALIICVAIGLRTRRALPFILPVSAFAGATAMLQVQSPGAHHFYILMPFLGGAIAAGTILLARRIGSPGTLASLLFIAFLAIPAATKYLRSAHAFPPSAFPQPRMRSDLPELTRLAYWLVKNIHAGEQYCAVGSGAFNPSLVDNVWQLAPELRRKMPASGTMSEVDSRDGPPKESLKDCTVMLVADPIQVSLAPEQQQGVVTVARSILRSENIGRAYALQPDEFKLSKGVVVRVYRRTRAVTDDEFKGLIAVYTAAAAVKRR